MASEIRQHMKTCKPKNAVKAMAHTRPLRRKAVMGIFGLLNDILDMETAYRDNIPEVFEQRYEVADFKLIPYGNAYVIHSAAAAIRAGTLGFGKFIVNTFNRQSIEIFRTFPDASLAFV
jgi:hypothetical protein